MANMRTRVGRGLAEDDGRLGDGPGDEIGQRPVLDLFGRDRRAVEEGQDDDVELQEEDHQDLGEDRGHEAAPAVEDDRGR